jgi:hypothetical protein
MFSFVKYFQQNYFSEKKNDFFENILWANHMKKYQRQKTFGDKIPSLTGRISVCFAGIWHNTAGFRSYWPDSGIGWIPSMVAGIQPMPPNSGNWIQKFEDLRE